MSLSTREAADQAVAAVHLHAVFPGLSLSALCNMLAMTKTLDCLCQGAHQQTTPLPSLLQASEPIEDPPAAAVAPAISAMSYLPTATPPPLMVTIGKLTAERLHDVDQESVQLPCDMVPSAHYVVDALGRSGTKSHNYVLSQWGHVSIGGKGEHTSTKRLEGCCLLLCFPMGRPCCTGINCSCNAVGLKPKGLYSIGLPATSKHPYIS